jgi:hypothetical protein
MTTNVLLLHVVAVAVGTVTLPVQADNSAVQA